MAAAEPARDRLWLVTGGAGFIGSHLCDALLAAGDRVRALDDLSTGRTAHLDSRVELFAGDVGDRALVARAAQRVHGIFHLAAIASVARGNEDWPGTHRVNLSATVGLFDVARTASPAGGPVPVVYASSAAVYGDTGGEIAREDRPPAPRTAYGADKLGCELHARVATAIHAVPTVGLRFFNVYGPRQDPSSPYSGVLSIFARRIAAGQGVVLHGGGAQTRDFVHVSDVVAHLVAAMALLDVRPAACEVVNVCTGRAISIRALAELLAGHRGVALAASDGPARAGDIAASCGCPSHAEARLGMRARVPIEAGVSTLF